jgi:hypothetical protein
MNQIPWGRVGRSLFQYATRNNIPPDRVRHVMRILPRVVAICGSFNQSRHTARRLGISLLGNNKPNLIIPVCPAYTHRNGIYTYNGLGLGVPLLVKAHLNFLRELQEILEIGSLTFLVADQVARVPELCDAIGVESAMFSRYIAHSTTAADRLVQMWGWRALPMTEFVPGFVAKARQARMDLEQDPKHLRGLRACALQRARMYEQIGYPPSVFYKRAVQTAAEYRTLGKHAVQRGLLICNHTTQNLRWFSDVDAGFLHNPIRVYKADRVQPQVSERFIA